MTALDEQETTITLGRTESVVRVWTSDLRHVRLLRKLCTTHTDSVREVAGGDEWAQFEVQPEFFWLRSAFRRKRTLSDIERSARADRLTGARQLRRSSEVDEQHRDREV